MKFDKKYSLKVAETHQHITRYANEKTLEIGKKTRVFANKKTARSTGLEPATSGSTV